MVILKLTLDILGLKKPKLFNLCEGGFLKKSLGSPDLAIQVC